MKLAAILFFISLLAGQLGGIKLTPYVTIYTHDIFWALLVAAFFWEKRPRSGSPTLSLPIVAFALVGAVSLLVNISRFSLPQILTSSLYLGRWAGYALLYFIVLHSSFSPLFWLRGLFLTGVGFSALGLFQFWLYPNLRNLSYLGWDPYYYRLFSTLLDPNFVGIIFILTIFIGLVLRGKKKNQRWLTIALGVTAVSLALTFSRSSYLAVFTGWLVYSWLRQQGKLITFLVVVFLLFFLIPKPPFEAFRLERSVSAWARVGNYQRSLDLFRGSPIFGWGFNTVRFVSEQRGWEERDGLSRAGAGIDSSLLFVLNTTGMLGFLVFLWLLGRVVQIGRVVYRNKKNRVLGAVFLSSLVALGVHSLFSNSLFYPWVMIWMWILVGVIERSQLSGSSP